MRKFLNLIFVPGWIELTAANAVRTSCMIFTALEQPKVDGVPGLARTLYAACYLPLYILFSGRLDRVVCRRRSYLRSTRTCIACRRFLHANVIFVGARSIVYRRPASPFVLAQDEARLKGSSSCRATGTKATNQLTNRLVGGRERVHIRTSRRSILSARKVLRPISIEL